MPSTSRTVAANPTRGTRNGSAFLAGSRTASWPTSGRGACSTQVARSGFLVEALRNRGVEAFGIDLSPYAIEHVHESVKPYCRVGSVTDPLDGPYDLIVSIEVVEHMEARDAETALQNFCSQTDDLLLSSSPLDYREPTHVNVQPPEVWAEQLARHGFFRDVDYDASFITPWAGRFRRVRRTAPPPCPPVRAAVLAPAARGQRSSRLLAGGSSEARRGGTSP